MTERVMAMATDRGDDRKQGKKRGARSPVLQGLDAQGVQCQGEVDLDGGGYPQLNASNPGVVAQPRKHTKGGGALPGSGGHQADIVKNVTLELPPMPSMGGLTAQMGVRTLSLPPAMDFRSGWGRGLGESDPGYSQAVWEHQQEEEEKVRRESAASLEQAARQEELEYRRRNEDAVGREQERNYEIQSKEDEALRLAGEREVVRGQEARIHADHERLYAEAAAREEEATRQQARAAEDTRNEGAWREQRNQLMEAQYDVHRGDVVGAADADALELERDREEEYRAMNNQNDDPEPPGVPDEETADRRARAEAAELERDHEEEYRAMHRQEDEYIDLSSSTDADYDVTQGMDQALADHVIQYPLSPVDTIALASHRREERASRDRREAGLFNAGPAENNDYGQYSDDEAAGMSADLN
jgi:hypothetical protein